MYIRLTKTSIWAQIADTVSKPPWKPLKPLDKNINTKTQKAYFKVLQKNQVSCPVQFGLRNRKPVLDLKSGLYNKSYDNAPICNWRAIQL